MNIPEDADDGEKIKAAEKFLDSKSKQAVTVTDPNGEFAKLGLIGPDGKLIQGLVTDQKDGKMSLRMSESNGAGMGGRLSAGENVNMEINNTKMNYDTVMGILKKSNDGTVHDPLQTKAKSLHRLGLVQNMFNRFTPPGQETKNPYMDAYEQRLKTIEDVNKVMSERGTTEEMITGKGNIEGGGAKFATGVQAANNQNITVTGNTSSSNNSGDGGGNDPNQKIITGSGIGGTLNVKGTLAGGFDATGSNLNEDDMKNIKAAFGVGWQMKTLETTPEGDKIEMWDKTGTNRMVILRDKAGKNRKVLSSHFDPNVTRAILGEGEWGNMNSRANG